MRRLSEVNANGTNEQGAVSVIVATALVALLGCAAIAVDVSMMYAERTQLRNGADAAALAIAQKCAKSTTDPDCVSTSSLAAGLANRNANDSLTNLKSVATSPASCLSSRPALPGMIYRRNSAAVAERPVGII